ncbi:ergothioneine biosynthesis protein EgtC [Plantactinospora veratri]|uniref:Gamma-glutamyl-hercynylcysteine sulfoxide hydrolase n=1 Tax=Plantactinospora veratri TaxID=1436122 RepID=A0ABU7SFQ7_9ACTN
MCRHLAYLGPPLPLAALLFDPPHSLARQSWVPRDMRGGGTVNADGFGVGWYPVDGPPVRYRRATPIWADDTLPVLAAATSAGAVLAAVRSATVGMPVVETAAAPFAEGPWLFSLNGAVPGWPDSIAALAGRLPTRDLMTLAAPTDAALLWALVRHRLRVGAAPAEAVAETVREVSAAAPGSRLNLLLTDGHLVVANTCGHALSVRAGGGSVLVSSEPLTEEPGWRPIPDGHLVVAAAGRVDVTPLGPGPAPTRPSGGW